jgi:nucleoside-diphosphate-sugar epimerase
MFPFTGCYGRVVTALRLQSIEARDPVTWWAQHEPATREYLHVDSVHSVLLLLELRPVIQPARNYGIESVRSKYHLFSLTPLSA